MKPQNSHQQPKSIIVGIATTLTALAAVFVITACSPNSSTETSKSNKSSSDTTSTKIVCKNCGVVLSVREIEVEGQGSGVGAVAGGVVGGLLGNQVGNGSGRDLATVAGVVGGAIAGNQIEKSSKKTKRYDIAVKMNSGEERIIHQAALPTVGKGDKIEIENNVIVKK